MIKVEEESASYKLPQCIQPPEQSEIDSQEYIPSRARRSIKRQLIRKKQKSQNYNLSLWKLQENMSYMEFLICNYSLFTQSHTDRRLMKINVLMSQTIKTRSPDQCRSHHQKMIKYHSDIPSIIEHIKGLRISDTNSNTTDDNVVKIEAQQENNDS